MRNLQQANDNVGASLLMAGFRIFRNKKREMILDESVKETDSIKCLVVAQIFIN